MQNINGYRSRRVYKFPQGDSRLIIRTTTYQRTDTRDSVITFSRHEHNAIRASITTPFPRISSASTGSFDLLPVELARMIFLQLDLYSIFKFRQASPNARVLVNSLNEYRLGTTYSLACLCSLLRTKLAGNVSLSEFWQALCTKYCSLCGNFSGYVLLPTWTRCCITCIKDAPEVEMQSLDRVKKSKLLSTAQLRQLTVFKTLPGKYTARPISYQARVAVVPLQEVESILGSRPQALRPEPHSRQWNYRYMAACRLPFYNTSNGTVERGVSCSGCQTAFEEDIIDDRNPGLHVLDFQYARDDFLEHFKWCEQSQILWEQSARGTKEPPSLGETSREGSYFRNFPRP